MKRNEKDKQAVKKAARTLLEALKREKLVLDWRQVEQQLLQVSIDTPEKLKETGSKQAWLNIKAMDPSACFNRLCASEGAIQGIK